MKINIKKILDELYDLRMEKEMSVIVSTQRLKAPFPDTPSGKDDIIKIRQRKEDNENFALDIDKIIEKILEE